VWTKNVTRSITRSAVVLVLMLLDMIVIDATIGTISEGENL
jgi:hypothetical protein